MLDCGFERRELPVENFCARGFHHLRDELSCHVPDFSLFISEAGAQRLHQRFRLTFFYRFLVLNDPLKTVRSHLWILGLRLNDQLLRYLCISYRFTPFLDRFKYAVADQTLLIRQVEQQRHSTLLEVRFYGSAKVEGQIAQEGHVCLQHSFVGFFHSHLEALHQVANPVRLDLQA